MVREDALSGVSVVSDTTCYLPREVVEREGITLVSLYCQFDGDEPFRESDLDDHAEFYERLQSSEALPTTTPPKVEDFVRAYEPLLSDGGNVVSVHISSGLSETCAMARRAAEELAADGKGGERVHVIDSASAAGGLGVIAMAAARAAAAGREAERIVELVRQARQETKLWVLLDTLEFLKRGGRIGGATAWIGSTLNVKPIITIESDVKAVERVRSRERGRERLIDFGRQLHTAGGDAWFVYHSVAREEVRHLADRLREVFWRPPEVIAELGPVIGTHTGPGMLAVGGMPSRFLE